VAAHSGTVEIHPDSNLENGGGMQLSGQMEMLSPPHIRT
jgi:hypothetical protein